MSIGANDELSNLELSNINRPSARLPILPYLIIPGQPAVTNQIRSTAGVPESVGNQDNASKPAHSTTSFNPEA